MCDTLAIVGDDGVLFAKNSDRDPNEAQVLEWHARQSHAGGAGLRTTYLEIPQVGQTHAVLLSRPYWMWGAEMGANEHGVTIGNEAVFTREPYAENGLTGMDLLRLALERCASAEEGVQTIVTLLEAYGQGGGCGHEYRSFTYHNSFIVADPARAFVLETAGKHYAVEEIWGARSISNGLTIPAFARRFSDRIKSYVAACAVRRARTQAAAERATGVRDLMHALRDHGTSNQQPRYAFHNGGLNAPCVHPAGRFASSQTTASWVADLKPGAIQHWVTGTAAPCTGLFKPIDVFDPLELGPAPTDRFDERTLWWRHERLHREVLKNPAELLPVYAHERDGLEKAWLRSPPAPREAFLEADCRLETWTRKVLARHARDVRPGFVRRYWNERNERAGLVTGLLETA
ncbi:MAG: C69 family dipeptidase [Planctomycetaceae bacterium]|nr:C69 family dipeptidase [Planctomycetaceae bacterium]